MLEKAVAQPGDVVLLFGANGCIGKGAIEMAKAKGLKIITTSRIYGADVNVTTDGNLQKVLELIDGREPKIILDCAGSPDLVGKKLAILGEAGRYVFVSVMRRWI